MARVSTDLRLQDRSARSRLKVRSTPYWRMVCEGQHLGYYKGARGGTWIARYRPPGADGNGVKRSLGVTDDVADANGKTVLNWKQALEKAMHWFESQENGGVDTFLDPNITVAEAVDAYIVIRDARHAQQAGRKVRSDAAQKLTRHVLQDHRLAQLPLAKITEADLKAWQLRVSPKYSSVQRVVNDLKAALNSAWSRHRRALPGDLPIVIKHGLSVEVPAVAEDKARENQILTDDQVRRIVAASLGLEEDFGRLVVLLAATGARFAQIRRMCVRDVQAEQGRVMVPESFKGRKRSTAYIRVQVGADVLSVLAPAIEGRSPDAPLLERWRHTQVKTAKRKNSAQVWEPHERGPWLTSSEMSRLWHLACEDAQAPASTIPYALRHSSIVRGLRMGLPIRLVAAIHDTSVAMIERHYSRWITEGLEDLAARAVVPLLAASADEPPVKRSR